VTDIAKTSNRHRKKNKRQVALKEVMDSAKTLIQRLHLMTSQKTFQKRSNQANRIEKG
jgi:hypothetical protein